VIDPYLGEALPVSSVDSPALGPEKRAAGQKIGGRITLFAAVRSAEDALNWGTPKPTALALDSIAGQLE
jgi:hypothetical protein